MVWQGHYPVTNILNTILSFHVSSHSKYYFFASFPEIKSLSFIRFSSLLLRHPRLFGTEEYILRNSTVDQNYCHINHENIPDAILCGLLVQCIEYPLFLLNFFNRKEQRRE